MPYSSQRRSSSNTVALPSLASTSGPSALPTRLTLPTKDDDDSQDGSEDAHPTDEHGQTSEPQRQVILLSNGKPLKSSLKSSSSSSVPPRTLVATFPHYQRARSDSDPPSPESPSPPPQKNVQISSSDAQQHASRPVILLSNGKPLKSSLKSSSSSVPPHSLVPTISFSQQLHTHHQRARSDFDPPSPSSSPSPNPESPTSSPPPPKNVHFSAKLATVQLYNKSVEPASLFHNADEIDDLSLPVIWGRSWNRAAADPFPKLDRSFSVSSPLPPLFPCGPSTTAQVMDSLRHTDEEFLSTMATFIRHVHAYSQSSLASSIGFMYDLANAIVGLVARLLTLIQAVMQHSDTPTNRVDNLMLAKEELYNVTISLAVYVRSLTLSLSSSILEETEKQILLRSITGTVQAGANCVAAIKVCLTFSISDIRFIVNLPSPMLIPAVSSTPGYEPVAVTSFSGPGKEDHTLQAQTSSQKTKRHSTWHFMNSDKLYQSTRLNDWILESSVSMMPQIEEEDACMY